jgi:hypothetical protein
MINKQIDGTTLTLLLSASITFVGVVIIYAAATGRSPANRLGFAAFISLLPAVLALIIVKLYGFKWRGAVAAYSILLLTTIVIQGWLR